MTDSVIVKWTKYI